MPDKDHIPEAPIDPKSEDFYYGCNYMSQKMIADSHDRVAKSKRPLWRTAELLRPPHQAKPEWRTRPV
jgi:hypothetical protein